MALLFVLIDYYNKYFKLCIIVVLILLLGQVLAAIFCPRTIFVFGKYTLLVLGPVLAQARLNVTTQKCPRTILAATFCPMGQKIAAKNCPRTKTCSKNCPRTLLGWDNFCHDTTTLARVHVHAELLMRKRKTKTRRI